MQAFQEGEAVAQSEYFRHCKLATNPTSSIINCLFRPGLDRCLWVWSGLRRQVRAGLGTSSHQIVRFQMEHVAGLTGRIDAGCRWRSEKGPLWRR